MVLQWRHLPIEKESLFFECSEFKANVQRFGFSILTFQFSVSVLNCRVHGGNHVELLSSVRGVVVSSRGLETNVESST